MFEILVVAIDESDYKERVLATASELASKFGSDVRVLHVLELGFVGRGDRSRSRVITRFRSS